MKYLSKAVRKNGIQMAVAAVWIAVTVMAAVTVAVSATADRTKKPRIVIDAGHGGSDGGVTGRLTGVKESDLNLEIAFLLGEYVEAAGFEVVYTRKSDGAVYEDADAMTMKQKDMAARKKIIDASDAVLVVSVHQNYFSSPKRRGSQVFFRGSNPEGKRLAMLTQNLLNANVNKKYNGRNYSALAGDYYILNCTELPAVIVECAFLSSPEDESLLLSYDFRRKIAYTVFCGIMRFVAETQNAA